MAQATALLPDRRRSKNSSLPRATFSGVWGLSAGIGTSPKTLRQQANSLYVDAATITLRNMGATRQELLDLAAQARLAIRRIDVMKDLAGISADLLAVAAAVVEMRPDHLATPLENLKSHLAALHKDRSA